MQVKRPTTFEELHRSITMKNLVRAFALSLVVTGAFASTHINHSANTVSGKVSALPIPQCPPGDPNGCGICKGGGCSVN